MALNLMSWSDFLPLLIFFGLGLSAVRGVSKRLARKIREVRLDSRIKRAEILISKLYDADESPYHISLEYRKNNHIGGEEFTYGEIVPASFLQLLRLTSPVEGEIFYDLGCGAGKAVFSAALGFPFLKVIGVELIPPMFQFCAKLKIQFIRLFNEIKYFKLQVPDVEFIHGDLLRVDFSDGNIFFLNATCFRDLDWDDLMRKLLALPVGIRVIVVSRQLDSEAFERIESGAYAMSWGFSSVFVYRKIK